MGTFYQIQGRPKELTDNSEDGLSFFKRKYSNIQPFSIVNKEYKFSFDEKNNNEFIIPMDGHLIKNIYLKADIELNNKKEEIDEWKDLKIFDNPRFLNYRIIDIPNIEDIDLEPIYSNFRNVIYNDYYNSDNWQNNIINYYHNESNSLTIIKNILNYYDLETNLLQSLDNNLVEYKNTKTQNLINFYINVLYLYYYNLDNFKKVYSSLVLSDNSITSDYSLNNFLEIYSFNYQNNSINQLYIKDQLDLYIDDLTIKLQNKKESLEANSINNVSITDVENTYEIYLNNTLLELNEGVWTNDIINAYSVSNDNDDSSSAINDTIGKINKKYSSFINETLITIYYNLYGSTLEDTSVDIIDSRNEYFQIYSNFITNIDSFIKSELIINTKYKDIYNLNVNDNSDIINVDINSIESLIKDDISFINNFYYDYKTIISIDLSEYNRIKDIKENIFDKINSYQYYNLSSIINTSSSINSGDEYVYTELIERYDFKSDSELLFYNIYNDNENILINEYKKVSAENEEILLREYIYNFNLTNDNIYKTLIQETFPLFDLTLFDTYPFYNFEKSNIKERSLFTNFKNIVLIQSCLNPVFLEEMYHEYVYERKLNIKKEYNIKIEIDISKYENELDDYQKQIIQSYTFYNKDYLQDKIPEYVLNSINDAHKYKYFHILTYENYLEFTRTNYDYFIYLYNEWNQKLQNIKKWNFLSQIEYKGIYFTYIELKHILQIENSISLLTNENTSSSSSVNLNENTSSSANINFESNELNTTEIIDKLNNKYQIYLETKIFDNLDVESLKVVINYNNNLKLNLRNGRTNFNDTTNINKISLFPETICILYYEYNYRHIAMIFENVSVNMKNFFVKKKIKSISIYPYHSPNLSKIVQYKELQIPIEEDFSKIFGNDIYYDLEQEKYIRKFDPQKNIYLYLELYRWTLYNDFYDLISKTYSNTPFEKISLENKTQNQIFKYINLQIDDQIIETLCDDTLNVYKKFFIENKKGFDKLLQSNYIPLIFWFMRSKNSAFPIISLSNTNVYLNLKCFENVKIKNNIGSIVIDYILLSPEERNEIILQDHVYILNTFNQKKLVLEKKNNFLKLPFHSQVIDLFIIFFDYKNEIISVDKYIESLKLKIDGKESVKYYDLKFHTNVTVWNHKYKGIDKNIVNISFALNPVLMDQPSGSMNYSSITDSVLKFIISDETFYEIYKYCKIVYRDYKYIKINSGQSSLV